MTHIQTHLFNHQMPETGRARRRDPETAKQAAKSVDVADLEGRVLDALRRHVDGLTTHELADYLDIPLVSVSPRMAPLRTKGLVCDSGDTRRTGSGRASIVWKAV